MRTRLMLVMLLMAMVVAACGAPAAPPAFPTASSKPAATLPPSMLPTMPPSILPTEVVPGQLVTRPTSEEWKNAPQAAVNAAADLAQRLKIDIDTIKLVNVEQVEWSDACLGIQQPGIMCAQVITSGYKIILEAEGKQYEYHTNESGSAVRLVGG
jgi:hypothetical protein